LRVGGAEQMAGHLMAGLSSSHDVAAATLGPAYNSAIEQRLRRFNVPLWHLGKHLGFDPRMFRALDRVLEKAQPHVVHTHLGVLRYALPALLRHKVPVVVHTMHNLAEHEADAVGRMVHRFAFRKRVLPVAISQEVAVSIKRVYGLECRAIVPNGIPVENYRGTTADRIHWRNQEGFEQDAFLFTCVARLEPQKNPLLLVRAFAALNDSRAHLVMLGEGSLREQVTAYVRARGLERQVHLLGSRKEIREWLAASDVFVLSSNWEGNPLAVMEAMAGGLPVIGTAVGGVPELVESGRQGMLVAAGDEGAFTNAMRTLLENPERRAAMAIAARARAMVAFDVEQMVRGYAAIYKAALAGASRPAVRAAA